ncbi:MAG TPA: hypothetical protein VMZ92_05010 [Planctomycetota bacterium]|nr:hypothetical protein [Planctomycetota bacterium]
MSDGRTHLVFLHHSCGSNWLASPDEKSSGGGLRAALEAAGFSVHDTHYKDDVPGIAGHPDEGRHPVGDHTDVCDWTHWFRYHLPGVKGWQCPAGAENRIVMFKTCFPGSNIAADGDEPGDPTSPEKTLANYKAVYVELAAVFAEDPDTLFVPVTAPPLSPAGKGYVKENAARTRSFNNWLAGDWLESYRKTTGLANVAVFDFFDVLANPAEDPTGPNGLREDYREGQNSHPTRDGNAAATARFIPFITAALKASAGA